MDLSFTEEQQSLRDLARKILETEVTPGRLREVEAGPEWFDRSLWSELGRSGLLGIGIPEELGGSGGGLLEACILLEEVGRTVAPIPAWPALVLGALPVATFGTDEQRRALLPAASSGETVLTAALAEPREDDPAPVLVEARSEASSWILDGTVPMVPAAHVAATILVPVRTPAGDTSIFLVDPNGGGVSLARQETTTGEPRFELTLTETAPAGILVEPGRDDASVRWLVERGTVGLCAIAVGLAERALELTAEYTAGREQFGRPLASFQAVQQRAADAYIDVQAMRWTTWEAAWRLSEGLPAAQEVAVAKFWAAEGGQRVLAAAQHLHGGVGVDVEYPLYRYTRWSKLVELTLGGAHRQLARLGAELRGG